MAPSTEEHYQLVVIGGGSGGLACALSAVECGATSVAVCDFVAPTPHGTTWGLGGTCVNVGCIPKKLLHRAGAVGTVLREDAEAYGWGATATTLPDWPELITRVQAHVKALSFQSRSALISNKISTTTHTRVSSTNTPLPCDELEGTTCSFARITS